MAQIPVYVRSTPKSVECPGAEEQMTIKDGVSLCECGLSVSPAVVELSVLEQDSVLWISRPILSKSERIAVPIEILGFERLTEKGPKEPFYSMSGNTKSYKGPDASHRLGTGPAVAASSSHRYKYGLGVFNHRISGTIVIVDETELAAALE